MTLDDILKGNIFTGDLELINFLDITEETENNTEKEQYFLKVLDTIYIRKIKTLKYGNLLIYLVTNTLDV